MRDGAMPMELLAASSVRSLERVRGTAVFLSSTQEGVPRALLHNVKHNKVLDAAVIIATVVIGKVAGVAPEGRLDLQTIADGIFIASHCATASWTKLICRRR